jgi:hypothetical protein
VSTPAPVTAGRVPPHSVEAEEQLLSACMLDGGGVVARCIESEIVPTVFYVPANRLIYEKLVELYNAGKPIDLAVVAEELKRTRQLDELGGYAYLTRISGRIPTTAGVAFFIDRLMKLSQLRDIVRAATSAVEDCYSYTGEDMEDLLRPVEKLLWNVRNQTIRPERVRSIMSLTIPMENDPSTLLGDRYVCRGHATMLIGGSGMGKSTLAYQASICWALGKPFMGIAVTAPKGYLVSVHFQSEDEDGDIAEVRECVLFAMNLTDEEKALLAQRLFIVTEKELSGDAFISDMAITVKKLGADLVWINPLHAFIGADIKDAQATAHFCRQGLNAANRDSQWAYMIVHHTPKPANNAGRDPKEREWNEVMYEGAGSADLVNFCRAVQVLKATKTEGEFNLYLAKRGKKADVFIEKESEAGTPYIELVTKIPMRHAKGKILLPGRKKETGLLYWESRQPDQPPEKGGARSNSGRKPAADFNDGEYLAIFPASNDEPGDTGALRKLAVQQVGIPKSSAYRHHTRLIEEGYLQPMPDGAIRRTARGDAAVNTYLAKRP